MLARSSSLAVSPCLLLNDELDFIAPKRSFGEYDEGSSGGQVYARVLSVFLTGRAVCARSK